MGRLPLWRRFPGVSKLALCFTAGLYTIFYCSVTSSYPSGVWDRGRSNHEPSNSPSAGRISPMYGRRSKNEFQSHCVYEFPD